MSDQQKAAKLPKWPFYLADAALSAVAVFILWRLGTFEGPSEMAIVAGCLLAAGLGAWMSIVPWLNEFRATNNLSQTTELNAAVSQIQNLEKVADLIRSANSQWQGVHDAATRTVNSANEITERIKTEATEFAKFLESAHSQERNSMRLEIEKLRRMEGDWLKVTVQILDHVFALNQAAARSGQTGLIAQLQQFQNAVRDVARRMGLVPYVPQNDEPFDPRAHQLADPNFTPPEGSKIGEVLATGFTYQGQLLRRALVLLAGNPPVEQPHQLAPEPQPEPEPEPQQEPAAETIPEELPPAEPNVFAEPAAVEAIEPEAHEAVPMFADLAEPEAASAPKRRQKDNAQLPLI